MRIIGTLDRSAFEPDPREAWRRARLLDKFLAGTDRERQRGVTRATHQAMMRNDEARMLELAHEVNRG
jgi:hypothetical protein